MNAKPHPLRWWALLVLAFAQFITIMDTSIIGVALPDIQAELGFEAEDLSWVFNAYVLAFGGLLLLGGRLSDLLGAKRVFLAGLLILLGGSLIAGLAESAGVELAGRAIQGAGAGLASPAALALVITLFSHDMSEMTKALGLFGAAAPIGGTAGVFLGGVLTDALDWRATLLINVPLVLAVLAAAPRLLPAGTRLPERLDLAGAVLSSAALGLAVFGIVEAPDAGWGSTQTVAVLAGALLLAIGFVASQRLVRDPLVPLRVFRERNLTAGNVTLLLLGAAWVPMWFVANLYLRQVLDMSAFEAGAALLPMTLLIVFVMVGGIGRIIGRFGTKAPLVLGLTILAAGLGLFSLVDANGGYVADFLWASLVAALGMSLSYVPALQTGLSALPPQQGGLASGLLGTSYQIGSALGLAILTVVGAGYGADEVGNPAALSDGYAAEFAGAGIVALAGAAAAALLIRTHSEPDAPPQEHAEEAERELVAV